jgi:hypothetical protein
MEKSISHEGSSSGNIATGSTTPTGTAVPVPTSLYDLSIADASVYLETKVQGSTFMGGVLGLTRAYYIGEAVALGCGAYAFGAGISSTAFFMGTYGLRYARQKDDAFNYALSGAVNGAWLVTGFAGPKKGLIGAIVGAAAGVILKIGGGLAYDSARIAWINNRKFTMENQKPRMLEVHKPQFRPEDSTLALRRQQLNVGAVEKASGDKQIEVTADTKKSGGWFS